MMTRKVEEGLVDVTMTQAEAQVLYNALTIAKMHVGEDVMVGDDNYIEVEHLRNVLADSVRNLRD